jgi:pimeloyl-ACP methyl ester carboxylesterase
VDLSWEELAPWEGKPVRVPAAFLGGQYDAPTYWGREAIERASEYLPELVWQKILPGSGHWMQQEKPAETTEAILDFLKALR